MSVFSEKLQIPFFYIKEQSPKRKFEITFVFVLFFIAEALRQDKKQH